MKQYYNSYNGERSTSGLHFVYCPKCGNKLVQKDMDAVLSNYCPKCQYVQYINPLPGVSVLIENEHKVLIGKRSQVSIGSNKWCLPCGFVEYHENHLEAAHREVFEETGLEIEITAMINVSSNHITPDLHTIVTVLSANVIGGQLKAGDELTEFAWLAEDDPFPAMAFEADEYIIKKYFEDALVRIPVDPRFKTVRESK